jgi:hypothetical protein
MWLAERRPLLASQEGLSSMELVLTVLHVSQLSDKHYYYLAILRSTNMSSLIHILHGEEASWEADSHSAGQVFRTVHPFRISH